MIKRILQENNNSCIPAVAAMITDKQQNDFIEYFGDKKEGYTLTNLFEFISLEGYYPGQDILSIYNNLNNENVSNILKNMRSIVVFKTPDGDIADFHCVLWLNGAFIDPSPYAKDRMSIDDYLNAEFSVKHWVPIFKLTDKIERNN